MKKFLFFIMISLPIMALAQKNSQWRGENRDGVYNETGLMKEWPADGPQLMWKFDNLGEGYTSVAIANEKIYITGMHGDVLTLYVLDLEGTLLKEKEIGKEWNTNYNGTRSTVCVNDGKLYIFSALGVLFCLDEATLNDVWEKDLIADFEARNLRFGMTESPLIVGENIYMTPGGVNHSIVALNKHTGSLIWSSPGTGGLSSYCSPLYISDQSVPMIVTCLGGPRQEGAGRVHENTLTAFNSETGEMLWSLPMTSGNDINPNTPMYVDGMIFSTTGYKGGSWQFRLKDGGKAAEQVWKNDEMDNQMGAAIKVGDYVYSSGHQASRYWFCLDWKTGETVYKDNSIAPCNVVFADGMLYCYSEKGTMNLVKPNPEKFELVSSFNVTLGTNQHWAHPVIHRGIMYLRHGDTLMAYNIKNK